jgi:hypothetical protein
LATFAHPHIPLSAAAEQQESKEFLQHHSNQQLTYAPLDFMARLWRDEAIQAVYQRRSEFHLNDSTD